MKISRIFINTCKKNIVQFIFLIISIFGIVSLQLLPPQILRKIVDDYLQKGIYDGIVNLGIIYLVVTLVSYLADFFKTILTTFIGQKVILEIRYFMSGKLMKLPMSYYNRTSVGDVMSRFTQDVEAVNTLFSDGLINMAVDLFKVVGIIISIYFINVALFGYALLLLPIIILIAVYFRKKVYECEIGIRRIIGKMNSFIQEAFSGIKLFKIYGYEDRISEAFDPLVDDQVHIRRRANAITSSFGCIMQFLKSIVICLFVILTTQQVNVITGITAGALAATVDLLGRLFAPIEALAVEFQTIQQVFAGLNRINEFMREAEEVRDIKQLSENQIDSNISFHNVSFGYYDSKNVINDISFQIEKGLKVALVGRTGSGKTTILNLLAGLYAPTKGSIQVNGYDPFALPAHLRRRIMGVVPQTVTTFTGKIKDIITLGDETITMQEVKDALAMVDLFDTIENLPDKYDTVIGEGEINLSFGQMQLLTLARAIVTNPPILLLDELTSGMDAVTEANILQAIKKVSFNRTIITISHRLSGIIDADYVYILSAGNIMEEGRPDELVANNGWYAKYKQLEDIGWQA